MKMSDHFSMPLRRVGYVLEDKDGRVGEMDFAPDAEYVVEAVNAYDGMADENDRMIEQLEEAKRALELSSAEIEHLYQRIAEQDAEIERLRARVAELEGQTVKVLRAVRGLCNSSAPMDGSVFFKVAGFQVGDAPFRALCVAAESAKNLLSAESKRAIYGDDVEQSGEAADD